MTNAALNELARQHVGQNAGDVRAPCPICAKAGRDDAVNITIKPDGAVLAFCHRCGESGAVKPDRVDGKRPAARARPARPPEDHCALWESGAEPGELVAHPYLVRKQVEAHGIRVAGDLLLIPLRNAAGELVGVQKIAPDKRFADGTEDKRHAKGTRKKGSYHVIGKPDGRIVIAEGYATGASIYEATGIAVAVAFDAGNMIHVAKALRAKHPRLDITIAADDDVGTSGNPGLTKAREAAHAVGGLVAIPDFGSDRPDGATDFNDLARHRGVEAVNRAIASVAASAIGEDQPGDDRDTDADAEREAIKHGAFPGVDGIQGGGALRHNDAAQVARLCVAGGERSNLAHKCAASLANNHRVYVRGGALVRVVTAAEAERGGLLLPQARTAARSREALVIVPAATAWLQTTLTADPGFFYFDHNGEAHDCDCPSGIAAAVRTLGEWPHIAPLLGMATAPFLRADGTVCSADGYDAAASVLLRNVGARVNIPNRPTRDDAVRALGTLLAPFGQFPFADNAHKAAYAALILTTITRHLYECAPATMMSAAAPGTGKTLLAECAGLIATGSAVGTRSWPVTPEEMRKTLTGIAVAGDSVVIFDNLVAGSHVSSAPLDQFLTAGTHRDRVLGTTNSTPAPNLATIVLTGNNITPRGDMARRTLQVRVVAETENPERRQFAIPDLRQHVRRHRGALVADALTILRAFVVAGAPAHSGTTLGSFEHWDRLVRGALLWAGADDPAQTQTDAMDDDDEQAGARMLLAALKDYQSGRPGAHFTVEAVRAALPTAIGNPIRTAMTTAAVDDEHLGYWLRANRDRPHGSLTLVKVPGRESAALWRVK